MSFLGLQFSQKTNENNSTWGTIVVKSIFFFRFLGELKIPKRHFEINWPLGALTELSCSWIVGFKSEFWRKLPVDCTNKATNLFWLPKARSWCFCLTHEDAHWAQWLLGLWKLFIEMFWKPYTFHWQFLRMISFFW